MSDFNNRLATNWKLPFAIADLAGGKWPKHARQAAVKISQQGNEPSLMRRLLAAIDEILKTASEITSAELAERDRADPEVEWHESQAWSLPDLAVPARRAAQRTRHQIGPAASDQP